ncbi:unnamed protein product [Merluccius merluccius]
MTTHAPQVLCSPTQPQSHSLRLGSGHLIITEDQADDVVSSANVMVVLARCQAVKNCSGSRVSGSEEVLWVLTLYDDG